MRHVSLVTGGTGFLGSHLVERLIRRGDRVICQVRRSSNTQWLDGLDVERLVLDCSVPPESRHLAIYSEVNSVFYAAGIMRASDPAGYEAANCRGIGNLCRALRRAKAKLRRFVLVSSLAAAGPAGAGEKISDGREDRPLSFYGKSKLMGEKTLEEYKNDFPIAILRPPVIYGPRDRGFYPFFRLARRHICLIPGNPGMWLSALHVEDVVEAAILADEKREANGRTFLLSDDQPRTLGEFVRSVGQAVTGLRLPLYVPSRLVRFLARHSAFLAEVFGIHLPLSADKLEELCVGSWSADDSQARRYLGFRPRWGLEQGLKDTHLWYTSMGW